MRRLSWDSEAHHEASFKPEHSFWEEHPLLLVAKHFATKGVIIFGVWGIKRLLWRHGQGWYA